MKETNYYCITTPQGTGGIGIIELFGRDALNITEKIFKPAKNKCKIKPNRIYLGNVYDDKQLIDEVIVYFTPAKKSLTKLDTIEINAHGGIMPCRLIGHLLKKFGVKELSQSRVIDLAHRQSGLDKIQKEALEYLLQAQTPLAVAVLLDQYNGVLSRALKLKKNHPKLRESARFGLALTHPKRILILGKPNVGKSTLFNALLGHDRAITHHLPGTTRDTIEDVLAIDGFPFVLVDTAGLRKSTQDAVEKIGISYARKEIPKADVILLVIENDEIASSGPESIRDHPRNDRIDSCHYERKRSNLVLIDALRDKTQAPVIVVLNKTDTFTKIQDTRYGIRNNFLPVSALKRTGLETLKKEILNACKLDKFRYKPGQAIILSENIVRHKGTKTRR